jgi:SOS-response transcriptional repressor LexA/DNA-binding XRE family transcriptional regulator
MVQKSAYPVPEWARKVLAFRRDRKLTQGALAEELSTSAMAVSRWERGQAEPSAEAYIRLGHLAGDPLCWFFWGRAGLDTADLMRVLPVARRRLRRGGIANIQIVHAGSVKRRSLKLADFVAIPVLPIQAATLGERAEEVADFDQLKPEAIWAAPAEWCPNPANTVSLRVKGNSMSPLILEGYIIAVDTSDLSHNKLLGQIVVARNIEEKRLLVSRLIRFDHTDALVSDQREYLPVVLSPESRWRIVGRVLWWTGRPADSGTKQA